MTLAQQIADRRFPVLVSLPKNDLDLAHAALAGGADGIKVHLNAHHRASGTVFGNFSSERDFLKKLSALPTSKFVMIGQEELPSREELLELKEMGFEGFNLYQKHVLPYVFESGMRPILALEHGFHHTHITAITQYRDAWIEASTVDPSHYGKKITAEDFANYTQISALSQRPVIVPSQKKIEIEDLPALRKTGVAALLLGVIVLGATAESIEQTVSRFVKAL